MTCDVHQRAGSSLPLKFVVDERDNVPLRRPQGSDIRGCFIAS